MSQLECPICHKLWTDTPEHRQPGFCCPGIKPPPTSSSGATPQTSTDEMMNALRERIQRRACGPSMSDVEQFANRTRTLERELEQCRAQLADAQRQITMDTECIERITRHGYELELRIKTMEGVIAASEEERLKWKRRYEEKEKPTLALGKELETERAALKKSEEDLAIALEISRSFWQALRPLNIKMIQVDDPGVHFTERIEFMKHALEAVLLFHSSKNWDSECQARWIELTGTEVATTRSLCDFIRSCLVTFVNETSHACDIINNALKP